MRLLIVEDSKLIRKVTRLAFPAKEHELHEAEDGQAALAPPGRGDRAFRRYSA